MKLYRLLPALALPLLMASCALNRKTIRIEPQLPADRSAVAQQSASSYRSQALERGEVEGYWRIATVMGERAKGEEAPYLKFVKTPGGEARVYGNNGCNTLNSDYACNPADSTLTFSKSITTMRACPDMKVAGLINDALAQARRYTIACTGQTYTLTLSGAGGQPLMVLTHQDYDFLNGTWEVVTLNGSAVKCPDMRLVIDLEEGRIHGNTGCNIMNGTIIPDMLEQGVVSFQDLSTTRMSCPNLSLENMLLVALEQTVSVRPSGPDTMDLLDSTGQPLVTLHRLPAEK